MTEPPNDFSPPEASGPPEPPDTGAILRQQLPLALTEAAATLIMVGVFALLGRLDRTVWLGALLGAAAALLNYGGMILSLLRAERAETPQKGQLMVRGMYLLRMLILIGVLVLCLMSHQFHPVAVLLPLAFMRIGIFITGLIEKKKQKGGK